MKFAVLCPGQGAQHSGMFDLVCEHPDALRAIERAAAALGEDPRRWLADTDAIFANALAQPLICVAQLAQWQALRSLLPQPAAFAGYSVGELACYGLSDALDAGELAMLARRRATLMDAAAADRPGGVFAVRGLARGPVERHCAGVAAFVAIVIAADAFVIGGAQAALQVAKSRMARAGGRITELRIGVASHTPLLEASVAGFREALEQSRLRGSAPPVVAGIDATLVTTRPRAIATLSAQLARTVEWARCLDTLYERGCRTYLELGPGRALSNMVRERHGDADARAVEEFRDLAAIVAWVRRKLA